jgi:hypothetical protein
MHKEKLKPLDQAKRLKELVRENSKLTEGVWTEVKVDGEHLATILGT